MNWRISFLIMLIIIGCASPAAQLGDKSLAKKDAPSFLIEATPQGKDIEDVEYFVKRTKELVTYELKYEEHDQEVSLTFNKDGNKLETEQDIEFDSLSSEVKGKINQYLKQKYTKYKINETELRTNALEVKFIDIEVSHGKNPTGLSEFTFSQDGLFVSEEVEQAPEGETLN